MFLNIFLKARCFGIRIFIFVGDENGRANKTAYFRRNGVL